MTTPEAVNETPTTQSSEVEAIDKIAAQIHLKYLANAKTAKVNRSELTVLPYGYLWTAVEEALTTLTAQHEACMRELIEEIISAVHSETVIQKIEAIAQRYLPTNDQEGSK